MLDVKRCSGDGDAAGCAQRCFEQNASLSKNKTNQHEVKKDTRIIVFLNDQKQQHHLPRLYLV